MLRFLLLSFVALTLSLSQFSRAAEPDFAPIKIQRIAVTYSSELQKIVNEVHRIYGVDKIFIAGGTARALIQNSFNGSPFIFRDFDIVLDANQQVSAESAQALGQNLEKIGLGRFSVENLRPRPRYNPELPPLQAHKYNAGFGFYVIDAHGIEFDISIFHSLKDLNLNGILDTDKLTVEIRYGDNIQEILNNKEKLFNRINDPESALQKVVNQGIPKVINWDAVKADPMNVSIRIVRALAKFNALPLDDITKKKLLQIIAADTTSNPLQMSRNLLKLFEDEQWEKEFKSLIEIGLFKRSFKSFSYSQFSSAFWQAQTKTEKVVQLLESANKEDSLQFLKTLADLEPELIDSVLPRLVKSKRLNVGYFTGEFAPFHKGHNGVVDTALTKGSLDLVFVIPTPHATNDPKTVNFSRKEWEERRAFVKAGLADNNHAWLWPFKIESEKEVKLGQTIEDLESFLKPNKPLTHVFGMDSYHRVLARDLQKTFPRPRIAVTRPGVPIPDTQLGSQVQVIENVFSGPVSATRILHDVAITGESDDLRSEVLDIVLKTPHYLRILSETRQAQEKAAEAIKDFDSWEQKTLIWDPRRNFAGLYEGEFPEFSSVHHQVITDLEKLGAKRMIVYIEDNSSARKSWLNEVRKHTGPLHIEISEDYSSVKEVNRVMLLHSGVANELLKSGYFGTNYRGKKGLVIYETPDQPLSAILRTIPAVKVISNGVKQCRNIFSALGS